MHLYQIDYVSNRTFSTVAYRSAYETERKGETNLQNVKPDAPDQYVLTYRGRDKIAAIL